MGPDAEHDEKDALEAFERLQELVVAFSETEFEALARKVVFGLQKSPPTWVMGDSYAFKSIWDEYCFYLHSGPVESLDWAWRHDVEQRVLAVVNEIAPPKAAVLSVGASFLEDSSDLLEQIGAIYVDGIAKQVKARVDRAGLNRSIERLL